MDNQNNPNSPNDPPSPGIPGATPPDLNPPPAPTPSPQPDWPPPTSPTTSPLDNPWDAPIQPPPITTVSASDTPWQQNTPPPAKSDLAPAGSGSAGPTPLPTSGLSTPTFTPPPPPTQTAEAPSGNWQNPYDTNTKPSQLPREPESPVTESLVSEQAPTDLSHLITNTPPESPPPNPNTDQTLVVPPANVEIPTVPVESKGIPKWLIGLGIALLIIVAGASAYFILGIGQPPKPTASIPTNKVSTPSQTPVPVATPVVQATPAASGSANFGELQGGQSATSAADLLRRQ